MSAVMIACGYVPVFEGERFIELADPSRVAHLVSCPNVKVTRKGYKGARKIVELQMLSLSDDLALKAKQGNPRRYSHNHAVNEEDWTGNPDRCWTVKPIRRRDRSLFRAVLESCAVKLPKLVAA
jgi:hypothetical protein